MDKDFEKTLALLDGQTVDAYIRSQLSDTDKQQIDSAIEILFSGFSLQKWLSGVTLGEAWKMALDLVRDYVFSFTMSNPATTYARTATFQHRKQWMVKIVSALHANEIINCPPEKFSAWQEDASIKIQNGADMLRNVITNFSAPSAPVKTSASFPTFRTIDMSKTHTIESNVRVREQME